MIRNTCCVCKNKAVEIIGSKSGLSVGRCTDCDLIYTIDIPEGYDTHYKSGHYHDLLDEERRDQTPYYLRFDHDHEVGKSRVNEFVFRFRVLDVGCANGGFMLAGLDEGWNVEGLEPDPEMAEFARGKTGCLVHTSWDTVEGKFDLITYHDVIEHIRDPRAELRRIKKYLAGMLVLDFPDADDERFYQLGMEWHHMKPREHLWFFNESNMRRLLKEEGYAVKDVSRPIPGKLVFYCNLEARVI